MTDAMKLRTLMNGLNESIKPTLNEAAAPTSVEVKKGGKTANGGTFKIDRIKIIYSPAGKRITAWVEYEVVLSKDHPKNPGKKFKEENNAIKFFDLIHNEY